MARIIADMTMGFLNGESDDFMKKNEGILRESQ
jgi:hypothetical protein